MTPGRKLFGTDGVRGEAGTFLTAELALALGRAATASLPAERPQVLIVRDTRESGPMLEAALAAGIAAAGGDALLGGVLPTPAAAILVRRLGLDLAAVVSASHNPYRDNGIKFFGGAGTKLDDEAEARIEALIGERGEFRPPSGARGDRGAAPGRVRELQGGADDYLRALESAFPLDLAGLTVALDCANGATHRAAPAIFERLGADGRGDRGRARRPQHQRRLRLDPPRQPGGARRRVGGDDRLRLRRRRRPGARRRRRRPAPTTATS